ncbi:MAG: M23 family metallopeptidase, partial [Sinomicrobium sp.]|nr:M23 family metallopeptidase [Sinomicrobium sp.]
MNRTRKKRKRLKKKLFSTYRLVVLNEDTFEEKFSFKLNRMNIFVLGILFTVSLIAGTIVLIAFTPLREYIPGYSSTSLKLEATELAYQTDSISNVLRYNNQYLEEIRKVLTGEIQSTTIDKDSIFQRYKPDTVGIAVAPSEQDLLLREEVALEDKYNLFESSTRVNFVLFPPIGGSVTQEYNPREKHFAVDVAAPQNTPVKAVADGTVIFSGWTAETGHTIIIEHPYEHLISVYKHNESNKKNQGDFIKSGEVIATVGNTGELTTGP